MNNVLETDDQLLGYGELILNAHEIVDMIHVDQKDWLRRRQYLIEHQDRVLGDPRHREAKVPKMCGCLHPPHIGLVCGYPIGMSYKTASNCECEG